MDQHGASRIEPVEPVVSDSWLIHIVTYLKEQATGANLIGLLGAFLALFCLLAIPDTNYWNIRLPLYVIVVAWTILRPPVALYLLPITVPWGSLDTITLGGFSLNSADILVGLLLVGWLLSFLLRPLLTQGVGDLPHDSPLDREKFALPRSVTLTMVVLLFAMILSTTVTTSITLSLKEIVKWVEVLIVLFVGAQYIRHPRQVWLIIAVMFLTAISQAIMGYVQFFFNIGPQAFIRDASLRVYGTFGQPNPYAGYINMTLLVALALTLLGRNWKTRILAGLTTVILAPLVVPPIWFTQSKGGAVAFTAALIFVVIVGFPRLRIWMAAGGIALLGVIGAYCAGILPETLLDPILRILGLTNISFTSPTPQDFATAERIAHWIAGIRMFVSHPFLGVGIGNYPAAYHNYFVTIFTNDLGHAHNYYINMAAEAGLIGLVALLLFLITVFVAGGRSLRAINSWYRQVKKQRSNPHANTPLLEASRTHRLLSTLTNHRALAIGLLASLMAVCVHNLVDNLYVHSMTSLFALLIVLVIRLEEITRSEMRNTGVYPE